MSKALAILFCIALSFQVDAQLYLGNFVGDDSDEINGTWNYDIPFGIPIPIKKFNDHFKIIFTPAYTFSQTFLSDKWVVDSDGTTTSIELDSDPAHVYKKSIFTHQSKIRTWSWEARLGLESSIGKFKVDLFYAPRYIQVGSFRRRYVQENEVIKVKDRFRDKADYYNINRFQHRVKASLSYWGLGVGGYLNLTPFFKSSTDIDLKKFGLTLVIRNEFWTNLLDLKGDDEETERKNPDVKQMMF
ncbi:hypothetical protein [Portibacter lacus]|uniref:DUF2490 domain-containing protein n=1 Tax=Portibacter lacus TaxID=1099794 RepID=A0AA37WDP4_9BACT|nr:hypothetical protein [Portibacter lacus]GLR18161.1 hypothetical protein GCM10007940_27760 [Portibacter lacus]